jgi:hypothetical protein
MRLHPVAPLLVPHKAVEDGVEVCGYAVPKGCTVFINVWAIMRDPAVWEDPGEFVPERFLGKAAGLDFKGKDGASSSSSSRSGGRRQCPGLPMAERVVPHLLASLLHAFVEVAGGHVGGGAGRERKIHHRQRPGCASLAHCSGYLASSLRQIKKIRCRCNLLSVWSGFFLFLVVLQVMSVSCCSFLVSATFLVSSK